MFEVKCTGKVLRISVFNVIPEDVCVAIFELVRNLCRQAYNNVNIFQEVCSPLYIEDLVLQGIYHDCMRG